jgi:hypothetical protein
MDGGRHYLLVSATCSSKSNGHMQSHDTYRLAFMQTTASLEAWSGFVADVARVEAGAAGNGWRLALTPMAAGACAFEIVLDGQGPVCDVRVGPHTVEDLALGSLDVVLPLVEAVVEGRVVLRRRYSALTGALLSSTTHVALANGTSIVLPREAARESSPGDNVECRDTHYVPYRRLPVAR